MKPKRWKKGEAAAFVGSFHPEPFGEQLVDWQRFFKYLKKYRSKRYP